VKQPTRQSLFSQAAAKLRADFNELVTVPHAGLKGGEAERIVRRFLQDHIPKRYDVGAGFIIDVKDVTSPQTDVIVYDALNCPVYRASEEAGIFPADNVALIVEVKSQLDKKELLDAGRKIAAIKALQRSGIDDADPRFAGSQCFVFAFDSPLTLETLGEHYQASIAENSLGRHIDHIVVLDKGVLSMMCQPPDTKGWGLAYFEGFGGAAAEGSHIGIGILPVGTDAIDYFFRILLSHLMFFRTIVPHPGFKLEDLGKIAVRYLTSLTAENDPVRRDRLLRLYAEDFRKHH
jgi:hypothetical protein